MGKIMSILRAVGTFYDLVPTIFQRLATNTGNGVAGKLRKREFLSKIPEFFGKPEFFSDLSFFENAQKKSLGLWLLNTSRQGPPLAHSGGAVVNRAYRRHDESA